MREVDPRLYIHAPVPHIIQNANLLHRAEQEAAGFNQQVAARMTRLFSAMPTFWLIMAWIVLWITANATLAHFDRLPWPLLLALASVPQLPLMIMIMVGQGLLGRKSELQADEAFKTTQNDFHNTEQIIAHLAKQDTELLHHTQLLTDLLEAHHATHI